MLKSRFLYAKLLWILWCLFNFFFKLINSSNTFICLCLIVIAELLFWYGCELNEFILYECCAFIFIPSGAPDWVFGYRMTISLFPHLWLLANFCIILNLFCLDLVLNVSCWLFCDSAAEPCAWFAQVHEEEEFCRNKLTVILPFFDIHVYLLLVISVWTSAC